MILPLDRWKQHAPLVIAHRGASADAPENTLSAFRLAREQGADGVEFDVKLSRDGEIVVHHDRTLDRTTTGKGPLSAYTLDELQQLDAGSWFQTQYAGERIPTLKEVIEAVGAELLLNIEITNYAHPGDELPVKVVELVFRHGIQDRVLLSSFNPIALRKVQQLSSAIPTGLLVMPQQPRMLRAWLRWRVLHDAYHPHLSMLEEHATRAAVPTLPVNVWTVNRPEDLRRCIRAGVSGMITDHPRKARELVDSVIATYHSH